VSQLFLEKGKLKVVVNPTHGGRIEQVYYQDIPLFYSSNKPTDSGWTNYGGDFLWLAPQAKWGGWPPVKEFDSLAWSFSKTDIKLEITSPSWNGIVLSRTIYFIDEELIVENSFSNTSSSPVEWGLWNISQLPVHELSVTFSATEVKVFDYPENITLDSLVATNNLSINNKYTVTPKQGLDFKLGAISDDNVLECSLGKLTLIKEIILSEKQLQTEFPHRCNIEVYKNDTYLEAELVWPMTRLSPGETFTGIQKFYVRKGD